jgi:hypothetical protein
MAESWSVDEVQTFLSLVAEERIQREIDGATRNEKVFQEVAQLLAAHGYHRTYKQCRDKLKKLKSDYRAIKDHNGRSGANRRTWKWFDQMDSIYGSRPASNGREGALDSATSLLENTMEDGTLCYVNILRLKASLYFYSHAYLIVKVVMVSNVLELFVASLICVAVICALLTNCTNFLFQMRCLRLIH